MIQWEGRVLASIMTRARSTMLHYEVCVSILCVIELPNGPPWSCPRPCPTVRWCSLAVASPSADKPKAVTCYVVHEDQIDGRGGKSTLYVHLYRAYTTVMANAKSSLVYEIHSKPIWRPEDKDIFTSVTKWRSLLISFMPRRYSQQRVWKQLLENWTLRFGSDNAVPLSQKTDLAKL